MIRYIQPLLQILQQKGMAPLGKSKKLKLSGAPLEISNRRDNKAFVTPRTLYKNIKRNANSNGYNNRSRNNSSMILDPNDESLILLVDFKADPSVSAKLLDRSLEPLKPYLSKVSNGKFYKGMITVLISGNRPKNHYLFSQNQSASGRKFNTRKRKSLFRGSAGVDTFSIENNFNQRESLFQRLMQTPKLDSIDDVDENATRYLFLDGRIGDLNTEQDSTLIPLVSFDWKMVQFRQLFRPEKKDAFIQKITNRAHSQGKRLRIWGAPNTESSWTSMLKSNVDWLSIDDHGRFARFASTFQIREGDR